MESSAENVQVLVNYLTQTLSSEYSVRKPAEDYLMSVEKQSGYSILLLQLADSEQVELSVRLAAVINFKNFVKRNWRIVDVGENKVRGHLTHRCYGARKNIMGESVWNFNTHNASQQ